MRKGIHACLNKDVIVMKASDLEYDFMIWDTGTD
jgi:hypothetical protein